LTLALADAEPCVAELRDRLKNADSWKTWWPYSLGFTCLDAGLVQYLLAIVIALAPASWSKSHEDAAKIAGFALCLAVAAVTAVAQWYVLNHYPFSDNYWKEFRKDIFSNGFRSRPKLPHDGVYARLMPSALHGVGVFAIIYIPKDTYVFEPDDAELISVKAAQTNELAPPLRRLYEDFCVLEGGTYSCPTSLNLLTPSWFLNNSKNPNMAADSSLRFYALRDIVAGEELTADYDTYSENQPTEGAE
jgi:hypothetical protein